MQLVVQYLKCSPKYLEKTNQKSKQDSLGTEEFDIYFYVIFKHYCYYLISLKEIEN